MATVNLSWMDWLLDAVISFDRELQTYISYGIIIYGLFVFCTFAPGFTAPYGRYVNSSFARGSFNFDARTGWFIQELPAFLVPCVILCLSDHTKLQSLPNKIFISFYLIHYFHR